jgi:hypothetical protein
MRDMKKYRKTDISRDCHAVVAGISKDKLSAEDMELYRFMVGGVQAK